MQRIMIIGSAGAGKSTAARIVGEALDLPVYHMDRDVYWLPGWQERAPAQRIEKVKEIAEKAEWVFEGSFSSTYNIRAARAEVLIWLDFPLGLRLWRVVRRAFRHRGQSRDDMAEGCEERLNMLPGFMWFVLRTAKSSRRKAGGFFERCELSKHRFENQSELNAFIEEIARKRSLS